jgi:glutamine amidotransferase
VQLKDDDVRVNLAELNGPEDRLAIVVTEPLTTNETWIAFQPGEFKVFVDGIPIPDRRATVRVPEPSLAHP